jgi:hypothetical protein
MQCKANQLSITKDIGTKIPLKVLSRHQVILNQANAYSIFLQSEEYNGF